MGMTREQCQAGLLLCTAARRLDEMEDMLKVTKVGDGHSYRGFAMSVGDRCDAGASHDADVVVDLETGRLIFAAAKKIIQERMQALGVEA